MLNAWVCRAASHAKGNAASAPSDEDEEVYLEIFRPGMPTHSCLSSLVNACFIVSASGPERDECDIGNRDPALKKSYRGLVNLK